MFMENNIQVEHSGIIELPSFNDFPDWNLVIGEVHKDIPFDIKRIYYINQLHNPTAVRGKHAHKKLEQIIFCINGNFTLVLDDGINKQSILMNNPCIWIKLWAKLWHDMMEFSPDCVILVLADDYYNKEDYIRNYEEFLQYIKE